MTDLADRLRAALDQAEQTARAVGPSFDGVWRASHGQLLNGPYVLLAEHHV